METDAVLVLPRPSTTERVTLIVPCPDGLIVNSTLRTDEAFGPHTETSKSVFSRISSGSAFQVPDNLSSTDAVCAEPPLEAHSTKAVMVAATTWVRTGSSCNVQRARMVMSGQAAWAGVSGLPRPEPRMGAGVLVYFRQSLPLDQPRRPRRPCGADPNPG